MGQWDSRPSTIFTSSQLTMLTIFFKLFLMGHLSQWCHFRHNRTFVQRNVIYFHYCGTVGQLSQQKKSEKKIGLCIIPTWCGWKNYWCDRDILDFCHNNGTFLPMLGLLAAKMSQKCQVGQWDSCPIKKKIWVKNFPSWLG